MAIQGSFINFTPAYGFTGSTGEFFGLSYNSTGQLIGNIDEIQPKNYSPFVNHATQNSYQGETLSSDGNYACSANVVIGKGNYINKNNLSEIGSETIIGQMNSIYNCSGLGSGENILIGSKNILTAESQNNFFSGLKNKSIGANVYNSVLLGSNNTISGSNNIGVGWANQVCGAQFNLGIGYNTQVYPGNCGIAIGFVAQVYCNGGIAIGQESVATGVCSTIIGNCSSSTFNDSAVIGSNLSAVGECRTHMLQPNVRNIPIMTFNSDLAYYTGVTGGTAGDFYMFDAAGFYVLTVAGFNP